MVSKPKLINLLLINKIKIIYHSSFLKLSGIYKTKPELGAFALTVVLIFELNTLYYYLFKIIYFDHKNSITLPTYHPLNITSS